MTEVIIASVLLAIALVPIIKALAISQTNTNIIERKTMSLVFAEGKLDQIRTQALQNYDDSFAESSVVLEGLYLCTVADASAGAYLRTITVSVGFDLDGDDTLDSDEIHVTLSTYVAERS